MMIEPPGLSGVSASASANSVESRRGANALVSSERRRSSCLSVVSGAIGGIAKALLIRQSTRPYSSSDASTSARQASSSSMSVGTTSARRPCDRTTSAILSRRLRVREARTRSAPSLAASSPSDRPSPGPTPDSTTTFPSSSCGSSVTSGPFQFADRAVMVARSTPTGQ